MSLDINTKTECVAIWYIGEERPILYNDVENITDVQADGDELEFIINNFTNIVIPKHRRIVRFFGDTAKMIVGNL